MKDSNALGGPEQEEFYKLGGHEAATALLLWCGANEPQAPAPGKDDFHLEARDMYLVALMNRVI